MRSRARTQIGRLLVASVQDAPVAALLAPLGPELAALPAAATHHGVDSYAYEALADESVPPAVLDELRAGHYRVAMTRTQVLADLARLDDALRASAHDYLVIKGPVLAESVYRRRARRSYSDLDVIVGPQAIEGATEVLERAGFEVIDRNWDLLSATRAAELHLCGPTGTMVDLHWHPINNASLRAATRIDVGSLFAEAREVDVAGRQIPTPDPARTLVHVALHAANSGGSRLVWVKDVEQCARADDLDWSAVTATARAWRVVPAVAVMLSRARQTFGLRVPPAVWNDLGPARRYQQLVEPICRLEPAERDRGGRSAARFVARSCREDTVSSLREMARRATRWARTTDRGRQGGAGVDRDPDSSGSPLHDAGGVQGRRAYFAGVASGRW